MAQSGPYLGIDAGGTSTQAVLIAEDGTVLGYGQGGAGNHTTIGVERAREAVVAAVRQALLGTELTPVAVAFGSAGLEHPGDPKLALRMLPEELHNCSLVFDTDALMALEGALGGFSGIVVAAGTGAIAFGRDMHGNRSLAGGWGWRIGDEGSAYWIGCHALSVVTKAMDGRGQRTDLKDLIMGWLQVQDAQGLLDWAYHPSRDPADIAGLSSLVDAAARRGDAVAQGILLAATTELLDAVTAVFRRMEHAWELPVRVSYTGGVFQSNTVVRAFEEGLRTRGWGTALAPMLSPVWGAALHAWRLGHAKLTQRELWSVRISGDVLGALQQGSQARIASTRV